MKRYLLVLVIVLTSLYVHDCRKLKEDAKKRSGESSFGSELNNFRLQKRLHQLKQFSQKASKRLASLTDYSRFYNTYLDKLLRVRVPGTVGHRLVKEFIINTLKDYGWKVEQQPFQSPTPLGPRNFTNIIATLYPESDRVIAFAAHYDSKVIPPVDGKYFVAATDSAVPCGILLDLARVLALKAHAAKKAPKTVSPQLLFLDGEEAFMSWTETDSLYGSRFMANTFSTKPHHNPELAAKQVTQLDAMDAFVLFDLLGAKHPKFYNFFGSTLNLYNSMSSIETNLRKMGELTGCDDAENCRYFVGQPPQPMYIEDDHIPFLRKNVPILHLIPAPFPEVWHKLSDDESAIDPTTVENLLKIFRHFACAYIGLE